MYPRSSTGWESGSRPIGCTGSSTSGANESATSAAAEPARRDERPQDVLRPQGSVAALGPSRIPTRAHPVLQAQARPQHVRDLSDPGELICGPVGAMTERRAAWSCAIAAALCAL